uniref:Family with sequence similarity 83 member E n=1 Tax=Astyanax mexicanus TaxID=7994 RepID=A0A8B9H212_ASTMX
MNNSQQQSLDETAVFSPLTESSPEFLHSEAERCALEHLLTSGPGAFYTKLSKEGLTHFLSPEEVNQVAGWAEDYRISEVLLDSGNLEDESESGTQGFSNQYFPVHSDTPAPSLELGWPEEARLEGVDQAVVYTSPPVEQMPHVREVVRRLLQEATMVGTGFLLIDMDRDFFCFDQWAESPVKVKVHCTLLFFNYRFFPLKLGQILFHGTVYINFFICHFFQNIRVRTAGGKTFYSRDGQMVVGELKENFILVDLKTVVLGSYSLTWTDAHLHRQLITVLSGPGVASFDREFRILYAESLPIPDLWKSGRPVGVPNSDANTLYQPEYLEQFNQKIALMERPSSPPPPPTDCSVDWEALGVIQWNEGLPDGLGDLPGVSFLFVPHFYVPNQITLFIKSGPNLTRLKSLKLVSNSSAQTLSTYMLIAMQTFTSTINTMNKREQADQFLLRGVRHSR